MRFDQQEGMVGYRAKKLGIGGKQYWRCVKEDDRVEGFQEVDYFS